MDDARDDSEDVDDDRVVNGEEEPASEERPVDRFRRSATGAVVAAGLLGLRDALEGRPEKEEVAIVNEAPTAPPRDVDVVIDFDHPERSIVVVRRPADDTGSNED
ncbi:MAG TPA: hypothetical protein VKH17_10680 [Acidimicrobiia bacterium]|nr:hypothetical protein [Acidimicrobiia bacterium]